MANEIINYLKRNNGSGHIVEHIGWHESGDYLLRLLFSTQEKGFRQHRYEVEKEYDVIDAAEVESLERMTCGRRMNDFGPWERESNQDFWKIKPNGDKVCSFCGSLSPDNVLAIIEKHGVGCIEVSDKNYKWYISQPKIGNALEGGTKYYRHHDTPGFIDAVNAALAEKRIPNPH